MWKRGTSPEGLHPYGDGKRVKPATAKDTDGCERAKPTERGKTQLSPEEAAAGWQQPRRVVSSTSYSPPTPTHTANPFAALEVEEVVPVQPARRLDAQSERRLEEPAKSVASTNGTSGRKSRSRAKKVPAAVPSQTDGLSARREPTDELSVRRESTDELSVRRESMDELSVRRESTAELSARR